MKGCVPRLRLERFLPSVGFEPGTARSAGQRLTCPTNTEERLSILR